MTEISLSDQINSLFLELNNTNENDEKVKIKKSSLENELSHLKEYKVLTANKSIIDIFNKFTQVGNGAFGEVFKATDPSGNNYAFKRIKLFGKENKDQEVLREVIAYQKLRHENVVNFYNYWIEIDNIVTLYLYLFMELCEENLSDWFKRKNNRSTLDSYRHFKRTKMIGQILEGVKYIHSNNIIHRDLKPSNILIDIHGVCKIADFGLSTFHASRQENIAQYYHTQGKGTLLYAAPEQLENRKYDSKVDIYSLGIIFMQFFVNFITDEALFNAIKILREKHKLPQPFGDIKSNPLFAEKKMILSMTESNPELRPTIEQVIERDDFVKKRKNVHTIDLSNEWILHEGVNAPYLVGHEAVSIGNLIYSFGGETPDDNLTSPKSQIKVYCLDTVSLQWNKIQQDQCNENIPANRIYHSVVFYDNLIYLWGGWCGGKNDNDLFCFDPEKRKWLSTPNQLGEIPVHRIAQSTCVLGNFMYIFGGYISSTKRCTNEVYRLNLNSFKWNQVVMNGKPPEAKRSSHSVLIGGNMYIFGGYSFDENGKRVFDNGLSYFNVNNNIWFHLNFNQSIEGRAGHSLFNYNDKIYSYGGRKNDIYFMNLHQFDPENKVYTSIIVPGNNPGERRDQTCCVVGSIMFVFGGVKGEFPNPVYLNELYSLDLKMLDT